MYHIFCLFRQSKYTNFIDLIPPYTNTLFELLSFLSTLTFSNQQGENPLVRAYVYSYKKNKC